MTIAAVEIRIVAVPDVHVRWNAQLPEFVPHLNFVSVIDDDGVRGTASTWLPTLRHELVDAVDQYLGPLIIGREAADHAEIWADMERVHYFTPMRAALSALDVALWDLRSKQAGLPLHGLLGTRRDRLDCYASGLPQPSADAAIADACAARDLGFHGYKLHTFSPPAHDVEVCRALRATLGPDFHLVLDPVNSYDRGGALEVGRALDELGFAWFEAPIRDDDLEGYQRLCRELETPIANGEVRVRGIDDYRELLRLGAVDLVRCAADVQGGLTVLRAAGELASRYGTRCEPRAYGSTLVQALHLHWSLAVDNCSLFEVPFPRQWLDFGMATTLTPEPDGTVRAPAGPGLGVAVDWDAVEDATVLARNFGGYPR